MTEAANLTPSQHKVLQTIVDWIAANGYPPTRTEIARSCGFRSVNASQYYLETLQRKGRIELVPGVARGIKINNNDQLVRS